MSSLEKRIREEQTKRLALRQEISRVKAERHQVALRMDEIRIKHEMESGAAQVSEHCLQHFQGLISNANHRIEIH
jgi:hypothetical protein